LFAGLELGLDLGLDFFLGPLPGLALVHYARHCFLFGSILGRGAS
jgi:hypothetical protein